jgi:broad specificity phosphatase PhoE
MLTIYFSPHGESTDNAAGRASGHADVPLNEHGWQEAQQLGEHYAGYTIDAVFCSDLQRAYITGEIAFSARAIPIFRDARLREFDYGQMTQCAPKELALETHLTNPFPDGESITAAVQRVGNFLREVPRDYDDKAIVVIGHSATKHGLEYWSSDLPLEEVIKIPWEWRDVAIWPYQFDNPLKRTL